MQKFRKIISGLTLGLSLVTLPAMAATQRHPTAQPARLQSIAHPALWQVQKGATTIYLFGTVHALPADVVWLDGKLEQAFNRSDTLVTEIADQNPEEMRNQLLAKALLPQGSNLRDSLPPKTRLALEKALTGIGEPVSRLDPFRPWYAAVALSTLPLIKAGYDPEQGVDTKLGALAKARGQKREALETAAYQFGLFDGLPLPLQKSYLQEVAVGAPKITGELAAMINAWKAGDAVKLARLMNAEESDPRLAEVLLYQRNRAWAQWIKVHLDQPGTLFVAVGAGHLAGKGSLQEQLQKLGITVKRVQ
jgi:uncharacterized protein YbaP (TraB family)